MAEEYYHASHDILEIGKVLDQSRLMPNQLQWQWEMVRSAVQGEPEPRNLAVLKALLLTDIFIGQGKQQVLPFVLKEVLLEHVRAREFADKPGRLESTFLSPSLEDAQRFREMTRQTYDRPYLYVCSVRYGVPIFRADVSHANSVNPLAPIDEQLNELLSRARTYWKGDESDNPCIELLAPLGTVNITAQTDW